MNNLIKVKFKEAGKWADNPADPIFEVEAGEEKKVSASLANVLIESGKGEIVTDTEIKEETVQGNPAIKDKTNAESKESPSKKDKKKGFLSNA